ncbi:TPR domain-containing protein [Thozetella sp. PMI_491]|nr:TPR domain-containing protein [Thozetella sp. PMI_491]
MAARNTIFMTPEESENVQKKVRDLMQKFQAQIGQPREASDPKAVIQKAVSSSLMQDLASAAFGLGVPKTTSDTIVAYAVGCPYPPCTVEISELQPMNLADLRMETHHRGKVLFLRRVSPVVELKASSWAAVQGSISEDVERLEAFLHKSKHGRDILETGSEFLVKEPYYTLDHQGDPTIRIDHPSDLIVVAYSDGPESWRQTHTSSTNTTVTASECKERGNAAIQMEEYARAHACYTEGLKLLSKDTDAPNTLVNDLYRNRSHVNLLLNRFDEARSDALSSLTHGEAEMDKRLDAKAFYRAGTAAYNLGDFEDAKGFFEEQEKLEPSNQYAKISLRKIKIRLQEKSSGMYDFKKITASLPKTRGRADVASFDGHTEIKESPGAGRGLFATQDIGLGEIIMCEKAFCVVWGHEDQAFSALTCDLRDDAAIRVFPAGLHRAVVQKLLDNPSQAGKVLELFSDYRSDASSAHTSDGDPVIDTFQIHDSIQRNAFAAGQQSEQEDISNASTGLWIRASYVNHSCIPNTKKDLFGDLMVLRAARQIATGEEITHVYDESTDYDARAAALQKTWAFKCSCALCMAEEADDPAVRKRRRELHEEAAAFIQKESAPRARKLVVARAKRLHQSINDTYNEDRYQGLPRRALLGIEQWLQAAPSR